MKNKIFLLAIVVVFTMSCKAQPTVHTNSKRAMGLFDMAGKSLDQKRWAEGEDYIKKAIAEDPKFIEAHFLLSDAYFYQGKYDESIASLKAGIAIDDKAQPSALVKLADLEYSRGKYADAITHYNQYTAIDTTDKKIMPIAKRGLTRSTVALDLFNHPVAYTPVNVGDGLNSANAEYSVYMTVDEQTAVTTVLRPRDAETKGKAAVEEDLYISTFKDGKWAKSVPMPQPVNSHDNEGSQCISADGNYLFFTGCHRDDGFGSCDLYVAVKSGGTWGEPFNLGEGVNSDKWDTQPSFASDGHTLFFVSARPGGQGGHDIWFVTLGDNGIFSTPENLGPTINTTGDENSPFIHPDGKSLYFASKGHPGLGGFDLFVSRKAEDGKWQKPKNLGYPINTFGNEISLFVASCSGKAYITSDKPGGYGKLDIYSFDLGAENAPSKVTFIRGVITDKATGKALGGIATVTDLKTKQPVASAQADTKTGAYTVSLPSGGNYALEIVKDGYLFYSANFVLPASSDCKPFALSAALSPIKSGESVVLRNVFFDPDKYDLKPESTLELDKLVALLNKSTAVSIVVNGHTDDAGEDAKNITLSDNRAKAVMNYLISKGIAATRLSAKGYGETKPLVPNTSAENKAQNRRVEFVVK